MLDSSAWLIKRQRATPCAVGAVARRGLRAPRGPSPAPSPTPAGAAGGVPGLQGAPRRRRTVQNLGLRPSFRSTKLLPKANIREETAPHPPPPGGAGPAARRRGHGPGTVPSAAPPPAPRRWALTATSLPSDLGRVMSSVSWCCSPWQGGVDGAPLQGGPGGERSRDAEGVGQRRCFEYFCKGRLSRVAGCQMRANPLSRLATVGDSSCPLAAGRMRRPRPRAGAALSWVAPRQGQGPPCRLSTGSRLRFVTLSPAHPESERD